MRNLREKVGQREKSWRCLGLATLKLYWINPYSAKHYQVRYSWFDGALTVLPWSTGLAACTMMGWADSRSLKPFRRRAR